MTEHPDRPRRAEEELLPEDLLWAEGGHASDVVLTALADGQNAVVPASVRAHVDGCAACTIHLGNAALLSLHARREMTAVAEDARAPKRVPRLPVALGLLVAGLGLVPSLLDRPLEPAGVRTFVTHEAPVLASALRTLAARLLEPGSPVGLALTYGSAALLVLMAFAVMRLLPKKETSS
jgi:hypothetical protein